MQILKYMFGENFIKKILNHERDFSGILLEKNFNLFEHDAFEEIQNYFKAEDLKNNPITIEDSYIRGLKARGLFLPYLNAKSAHLEGLYLTEANLHNSDFSNTIFKNNDSVNGNFQETNFSYTQFDKTYFLKSDFSGVTQNTNFYKAIVKRTSFQKSNLGNVDFKDTRFIYANLRNIENLEKAINLESAKFYRTQVTKKDKKIINRKIRNGFLIIP